MEDPCHTIIGHFVPPTSSCYVPLERQLQFSSTNPSHINTQTTRSAEHKYWSDCRAIFNVGNMSTRILFFSLIQEDQILDVTVREIRWTNDIKKPKTPVKMRNTTVEIEH